VSQTKVYDLIILGAGPTGLFATYEYTQKNKDKKILIIEQGNSIKKRKPIETMMGVGGAGTFSDGKLHFTPVLSHEKLLDLFSLDHYQTIIDYVDQLFTDFGVTAPYTPQNPKEVQKIIDYCYQYGIKLYSRKCRHIGSDILPQIIKNIVKVLEKRGVEILCNTRIEKVLVKNKLVTGLKNKNRVFKAKKYLLVPGRIGTSWLQNQARQIGLDYSYQKVEIGVRVEFPASVMATHSKILHENIYTIQTPTYDDIVRTFCPCPNGRVAIEDYGDYISVNGHSTRNSPSPNSNFNFVTVLELTEPVENTTDYAISIAKTATIIGGGKPILQRLSDLRSGRRSTWPRIKRSYVQPTLKDVVPGDISLALPHRIVTNILEGLEKLDQVLPGLNSGSTLLYAPEIKLRGNRIKINKKMQTQIKNLYVAGDGAGTSGNIVGAAVSGILAAQGIHS
jgi:uncharacterized protein